MNLPHHTKYILSRCDETFILDVWYSVSKRTPAHIAGDPGDSYPSEGGDIIDYEVLLYGEDFELDAVEIDNMIEELEFNHHE